MLSATAATAAGALAQPRSEHRMGEVGAGLVDREIAYRCAIELTPSPATCGNTNHIQWLALRPARSSASARW